jgi:hypothetical protein
MAKSLYLLAGATRLVEDPACLRGTRDLPAPSADGAGRSKY